MTILVTGGCGFIGHHLVHQLLAQGHSVRVLDASPDPLSAGVELVRGSITDRDSVRRALAGVTCVYHLAANSDLWAPDKKQFHEVNFVGTQNVLDEAKRAGVERVVHTSTHGVFIGKSTRRRTAIDETVHTRAEDMLGPYFRAKHLAETAALAKSREGLSVVVVNPTILMGPGDRRLTPPSRMLLSFLQGITPAYLDCTLNAVDARDAALGHILAAERGRSGERYILGGANVTMREFLALLGEISGQRMPKRRVPRWLALGAAVASEYVADRVTHRRPLAPLTGVRIALRPVSFDTGKAERELGFSPRPLRDTVHDALQWFARQGTLAPGRILAAAE